jgi:dienelactone hydrolase
MNESNFRAKLLQCLGGEWPEACPLSSEVLEQFERPGYRVEKVRYQVEPLEWVSAYVLIPHNVSKACPAPGIAVWHQHCNIWTIGKGEPAGLIGDSTHFTGVALAKEGYVVLCPDSLCFEERQHPKLSGVDFERFAFTQYMLKGKSLAWKYILDMRRAIDYLASRPEVIPEMLGCYGHSLGSICTWLIGPWEPRLKCLIGNCALPTFAAMERNHLIGSFQIYIPGLRQFGDTSDIVSLIAPRPLHLNFGGKDRHSPIQEVREALEKIRTRYIESGSWDSFSCHIEEEGGHELSPSMWELIRAKLLRHLPPTSKLAE